MKHNENILSTKRSTAEGQTSPANAPHTSAKLRQYISRMLTIPDAQVDAEARRDAGGAKVEVDSLHGWMLSHVGVRASVRTPFSRGQQLIDCLVA